MPAPSLRVYRSPVSAAAEATAAPAEETAEAVPDYSTGPPWPDIDLEGVVTPDMPAELKDNFVLYVNKDKLLELEIPKGYSSGGNVRDLVLTNAEEIRNMFRGEAPDTHDAKLAYDLFWLMMDWDSRNELGVTPLKEIHRETRCHRQMHPLSGQLGEIQL